MTPLMSADERCQITKRTKYFISLRLRAMSRRSLYIVNGITIYRIAAAPVLLFLLWKQELDWFKWLLAASFFTDAIDGFIARKYKVTSIAGARLDSIGDDLTVLVAIIGLLALKWEFVVREKV